MLPLDRALSPRRGAARGRLLALAALLVGALGSAHAQSSAAFEVWPSVATLSLGSGEAYAAGVLTPAGGSLATGEYVARYELEGDGTAFMVTLTSDAFDAYLLVISPEGEVWEDDDGAGDTDAQVYVSDGDAQPGTWQVIVTSYEPEQEGSSIWTSRPGWERNRHHPRPRRHLPPPLRQRSSSGTR